MDAICNLLHAASEFTGLSIDKINFVFCMLLCLPLGLVFRLILHPTKVSTAIRRTVGLVWGVGLAVFCFGWETSILFGLSAVCYILTAVVSPSIVQRIVFISAIGTLSIAHLFRQITNYGVHAVDFSGPLMLTVQKVTYIAYNLHDGIAREQSKLTEEQKREKLSKVPSLLEYFSYIFHYSTVLAGPVCTFREFNDFIDGSDIRPKNPGDKEPSPLVDVIKKLLSGCLCAFIFILAGDDFPINRNADHTFITTQPFYWRVIYGWISGTVSKLRYYFAFKVSEAVNNMGGLGFNGYDENGNAKWNRITNINILKFEFAASMKMVCDSWNISTTLWLRRTVYERCSQHRTLAVFIMSSLWHGFYPGYYLMFLSVALFIEAGRMGRRVIRPYFQKSRSLAITYDVITCIVTALSVSEGGVPFQLLQLRMSIDYWRSLYFYAHIWSLLMILFCLPRMKPREKTRQDEPVEEINKNWINKLEHKGGSAEINYTKKIKIS